MILVDSSVWVSHFQSGLVHLGELLEDQAVMTHPYVIGELACGWLNPKDEIVNGLINLPKVDVVTISEFLHFMDAHDLVAKGLGFVDVNLLASSQLSDCELWTEDKRLIQAASDLGLSYPV